MSRKARTVPDFVSVDSPVKAFLEVPIAGHPKIDSIEIQQIVVPGTQADGNQANGTQADGTEAAASTTGYVALVHTPGGVDLYADPVLGLGRDWFDQDPAYANLPRAGFHLTSVEVAHWEMGGSRIRVEARFELADGQPVSFLADQPEGRDRVLSQFIPTPAIPELSLLRFLQVDGFGLLRRSSTLEVSVGRTPLATATFALPLGGRRRYAARYAAHCTVVGLNPTCCRPLPIRNSEHLRWHPTSGQDGSETLTFEMAIGEVATARYQQESEGAKKHLTLGDINQNWQPPRGDLQLRALSELRQRRRRNLNWNWSGTVEGSSLTDSTWTVTQ